MSFFNEFVYSVDHARKCQIEARSIENTECPRRSCKFWSFGFSVQEFFACRMLSAFACKTRLYPGFRSSGNQHSSVPYAFVSAFVSVVVSALFVCLQLFLLLILLLLLLWLLLVLFCSYYFECVLLSLLFLLLFLRLFVHWRCLLLMLLLVRFAFAFAVAFLLRVASVVVCAYVYGYVAFPHFLSFVHACKLLIILTYPYSLFFALLTNGCRHLRLTHSLCLRAFQSCYCRVLSFSHVYASVAIRMLNVIK